MAKTDCSKLKGADKKKCLEDQQKKGKATDKSHPLPPFMSKKKGKK